MFTEKIHGTFCQAGVVSEDMAHAKHGTLVVASKGMADKGLAFQPEADANKLNLYLRAVRANRVAEAVWEVLGDRLPAFVLGEVFGHGVQDLAYGASTAKDELLGFRVFDVYVGPPRSGGGHYLDDADLDAACEAMGL